MKIFDYKSRDLDGNLVSGKIFATSEHYAAKNLMSKDLIPVKIKKASIFTSLFYKIRPAILRFAIVEKQDLIRFCGEASLLIKSGVSVRQTVANLAKSMKGKMLSHVLNVVVIRLDAGYTLADAFSGFPYVFPNIFISFLGHADYANYTSIIFTQLSETLQSRKEINKELFEAMVPFTSSIAMIILAGYILSQVVMPQIIDIYAEKQRDLPIFTQLLADFFYFVEHSLVYIIMSSLVTFLGLKVFFSQFYITKYWWDKIMLQLPIYKRLRVLFAKMDFSRAISMSIKNGYPIQKVLQVSASVVQDFYFRRQILESVNKIAEGADLISSIRGMNLYTYSEIEILEVGREAESLESSFDNMVDFNRKELSHRVFLLKEGLNLFILVIMVFMISFYMVGFYLGYLYISF